MLLACSTGLCWEKSDNYLLSLSMDYAQPLFQYVVTLEDWNILHHLCTHSGPLVLEIQPFQQRMGLGCETHLEMRINAKIAIFHWVSGFGPIYFWSLY